MVGEDHRLAGSPDALHAPPELRDVGRFQLTAGDHPSDRVDNEHIRVEPLAPEGLEEGLQHPVTEAQPRVIEQAEALLRGMIDPGREGRCEQVQAVAPGGSVHLLVNVQDPPGRWHPKPPELGLARAQR